MNQDQQQSSKPYVVSTTHISSTTRKARKVRPATKWGAPP